MSEQAYVELKRMILTVEVRPGDAINLAQLTERLGLGRSALQLAIHRLSREGLVDIIPRVGVLVKAETLESFRDLVGARMLIEPHLARLAAQRLTQEQREALETLVATGWEKHTAQDRLGGMEVDRAFHQLIYQASGNQVLADIAVCLLDRSMRLWFLQPSSSDQPNVAELESVLKALKQGDADEAARQMTQHLWSVHHKNMALD